MQFYYGDRNLLRVLDEIAFWKRQEAEHTVVIRQIVPNLEPRYVTMLQEWELAFNQTEGVAIEYIQAVKRSNFNVNPELEQQIIQFVQFALGQSRNFILFLDELLTQSAAVRSNPVAPVVINHIRRESEYFIGVVEAFLNIVNPG